jgi:hypothetical protein
MTSQSSARGSIMPHIASIAVALAIGAVFIVLLLGLINMMRGGASNTSQNLMRWRVGLQFAAIVVIVAVLLLRGHG